MARHYSLTSSGEMARPVAGATLARSLPVIANLVLVAAHLASNNPSRMDARLFASSTPIRKARGKGSPSKAQVSSCTYSQRQAARASAQELDLLAGPKAVAVERVAAIFDVLLNDLARSRRDVALLRSADGHLGSQVKAMYQVAPFC
jgi:hypothetical protein